MNDEQRWRESLEAEVAAADAEHQARQSAEAQRDEAVGLLLDVVNHEDHWWAVQQARAFLVSLAASSPEGTPEP